MRYTTVQTEIDGPVGILTLNRPDRHNAYDDSLCADLSAALQELESHAQVRVVVLSALGKSFCTGSESAWLRHTADASEEEHHRNAAALAELLRLLDELSKPTVAGPGVQPEGAGRVR